MNPFVKNTLKIIPVFIFLFVLLYIIYIIFIYDDFNRLPKGIYIRSVVSPNGNYKLNIYKISEGMTMDWFMRVELEDMKTNEKKNLYYDYHLKDHNIKWIDDKNIQINKIKLNVQKETYDGRKHFH